MFRPFVNLELRHVLRDHDVNLAMLSTSQFNTCVKEAHEKMALQTGGGVPAYCLAPALGVTEGPVLDKLREWIRMFREWLQTPAGQVFLTILKSVIAALIAMLIAGS